MANANGYGVDELMAKLESIGAAYDEIANSVLKEVAPAAKSILQRAIPRSDKDKKHARDRVGISIKKYKKSNDKYLFVGPKGDFGYLFALEYGSLHQQARPFLSKVYRDAESQIFPMMGKSLEREYSKRMEGR